MLQMHLSGGGGTPRMQPKSNGKFTIASAQLVKFLAADCGFKYFHDNSHRAHRFTNLFKNAANSPFRGGGTPWMQPKSNGKLKIASYQLIKFLATDFGFKCFHYSGHCAHRVANLCKNAAKSHFRGGGTPWMQPKSNGKFKLASYQLVTFLAADLGLKYFHYSRHCAHRVANLYKNAANSHFRGGGTPWMQPKSNGKFILASYQPKTFLAAYFGFKYFHYTSHCAHRFTNLCKMLQMHLSGGGGTPWMQPKSNGKFILASDRPKWFLAAYFGFKYFHYSGHCAHRVANLCKNAANTPFRGWGDTLDATQK